MTQFISRLHTELRRARLTRRGATHAPKDVPMYGHKTYERMERIDLPPPAPVDMTLADALHNRQSADDGDPHIQLTLSECGTLFGHALRARSNKKRPYPSGGGLYPVETYLISSALEGQSPGIYHYNPSLHALERLWDMPQKMHMKDIARYPEGLPLSSLIVFTGVWKRSSAKYGNLTYLHTLLEAGHMSQNIVLTGTAIGLNLRPMAGFDDDKVLALLDLDEELEQPIHSITLCKPGAHASGVHMHIDEE